MDSDFTITTRQAIALAKFAGIELVDINPMIAVSDNGESYSVKSYILSPEGALKVLAAMCNTLIQEEANEIVCQIFNNYDREVKADLIPVDVATAALTLDEVKALMEVEA